MQSVKCNILHFALFVLDFTLNIYTSQKHNVQKVKCIFFINNSPPTDYLFHFFRLSRNRNHRKTGKRLFQLDVFTITSPIVKQVIRSSSSVASNYRVATRSRSDAEFYPKICIVLEEIDETQFWLDYLARVNLVKKRGDIRSFKLSRMIHRYLSPDFMIYFYKVILYKKNFYF